MHIFTQKRDLEIITTLRPVIRGRLASELPYSARLLRDVFKSFFKEDEGQYKKQRRRRVPSCWRHTPVIFLFARACLRLKKLNQLGSAMAHNPRNRTHQLDIEVEDAIFFFKKSMHM
jgi:hypothetical protein